MTPAAPLHRNLGRGMHSPLKFLAFPLLFIQANTWAVNICTDAFNGDSLFIVCTNNSMDVGYKRKDSAWAYVEDRSVKLTRRTNNTGRPQDAFTVLIDTLHLHGQDWGHKTLKIVSWDSIGADTQSIAISYLPLDRLVLLDSVRKEGDRWRVKIACTDSGKARCYFEADLGNFNVRGISQVDTLTYTPPGTPSRIHFGKDATYGRVVLMGFDQYLPVVPNAPTQPKIIPTLTRSTKRTPPVAAGRGGLFDFLGRWFSRKLL
jgi:hypothetical protein